MKNEKLTRKEIIDNRLKQAGWNVDDRAQVVEEFDIIIDSNLVQEAATPYAGRQSSASIPMFRDRFFGKPQTVSGNYIDNVKQ